MIFREVLDFGLMLTSSKRPHWQRGAVVVEEEPLFICFYVRSHKATGVWKGWSKTVFPAETDWVMLTDRFWDVYSTSWMWNMSAFLHKMIPLGAGLMLHKVKVLFPNSHGCSSLSLCFSCLYLHWYSENMKWCLCASGPQGVWGWQLIFWQDKQKRISLYISVRTCKNHKK